MALEMEAPITSDAAPTSLQVYLLGSLEFEDALALQRRLLYDISGDRSQAALIICEHSPIITVGRNGSRSQILFDPADLEVRGWRIRWVNRAGGCWLHLPGQLSVYPIFPLDRLGLTVNSYLRRLGETMQHLLGEFDIRSEVRPGGIWVGPRLVAGIGAAIRDWVSYYGLCLNVYPSLDLFRLVRSAPRASEPMTSIERERRGRIRPSMVRERLVEHFQEHFGFSRVSLFTDHPILEGRQERVRPPVARIS